MNAAELLPLIDRAECGSLLAEEAQQLRDGIRALDAARRATGGLQRALHSARAERNQLRADLDRVQQAACRTAEILRHAKGRLVELEAAIARVRDVAVDMRGITGARFWADALDKTLEQPQQPSGPVTVPGRGPVTTTEA